VRELTCAGHSQTDACFLHEASRTLFVGDLFYPGPVFVFPPGGSLHKLNQTVERLLALKSWDRLGLTHGDCFVSREVFRAFAASLQKITGGDAIWKWNVSFSLPLRETETATGTLLRWPFQN
jgi:glyoxylase-like metal-dependent hydrolase (beta-lactamase superfamily II)